ncbi:MAG: hypothetical protein J2P36_16995 [Ktedonobacteraceae bacterium]|nr:hypothetical protein [Ktedonobacteraceae bacterium]
MKLGVVLQKLPCADALSLPLLIDISLTEANVGKTPPYLIPKGPRDVR